MNRKQKKKKSLKKNIAVLYERWHPKIGISKRRWMKLFYE